jgi:prephenate dehydrogenase
MRVALLGLGQIGGSIARAIDEAGSDGSVVAWTPSGDGPRQAVDAGVIEVAAASIEDAVRGADLVVLAAPAPDCIALVRLLGGPLRGTLAADAVVTDVASTKRAIAAAADEVGLRFVGGHPMAGVEAAGFAASRADLFRDRPWVVVPSDDPAAVTRVEDLATACGARVVRMGAAEHDRAVAAVSHLPLLLSAALVEAVVGDAGGPRDDWPQAAPLRAGGWASMTRLAGGDPRMGAGILSTNAAEVAARARDLRTVLDAWIERLEADAGPDAAELERRLRAARDAADAG